MARKVETLTVFLSHNIGLQLSNSEGGEGIPMFAPTPLKCLVFLKRNLLLGQGRLRFFFFFSWVIMDSIALKSVDLWVGNTKQTNRNRVMQQPDVS